MRTPCLASPTFLLVRLYFDLGISLASLSAALKHLPYTFYTPCMLGPAAFSQYLLQLYHDLGISPVNFVIGALTGH